MNPLRLHILLFATLLTGCGDGGNGNSAPAPAPEPPKVSLHSVGFVGDSHFAALDSMAREIEGILAPGEVANVAVGGTLAPVWNPTANQFYQTQCVAFTAPEHTFIELCTGSAVLYPPPTTPADYRVAIEALARQWLEDGAGTVWLLTPPPHGLTYSQKERDIVDVYAVEIEQLCLAEEAVDSGIRCGPDLNMLLDPQLHLIDFVHLNAAGRAIAVDALLETLGI